jgi:tetratricopeptide (TPR) repeat protein
MKTFRHCFFGALLLLVPLASVAQSDRCQVKRDVGTQALEELTWKQLNSISEDIGEENYDEAYEDLQKLMRRASRDKYLQAILKQMLAQVEWSRGNFDPALSYFEEAVALDTLPDQTHFALMYQIAQLYYMKDRFDEALEKLELWFCTVPDEKVTALAYVLKASIHVQKEDWPQVLSAIDAAIAMDEDPKQNWYALKLAAHYEMEQYPQVAETLEILISRWPEVKRYWIQLSQIYYKLKQDERSLAVLALAYRKNLLDSSTDLTYLSSLYSNADVPYKAAEVLEKGIKDGIVKGNRSNWVMVADSWYAAEELEKALVAFEEGGRAAEDGNIDLRRGYILVDLERWPEALDALTRALDKGGLNERQTGEAHLLRGMAHFNLGDFDRASADWGRAGRYDKTRAAARQWMNHLREERLRQAS